MSDDATPSDAPLEDWRKTGRCSSCSHFITDFGEVPELYGHCKMYPRSGARAATEWACPEYKALPGFDELTRSVRPTMLTASDNKPRGIPSGGHEKRRRVIPGRSASSGLSRPPRPASSSSGSSAPSPRQVAEAKEMLGGGSGAMDNAALVEVLVGLVENFIGVDDVELGARWEGGTITMQPADPELKAHVMPVETFFHKIVMLRDRLRVMEQKINANSSLSDSDKVELQQYISRCYGSLTSFNVLFKHKGDKFSSK